MDKENKPHPSFLAPRRRSAFDQAAQRKQWVPAPGRYHGSQADEQVHRGAAWSNTSSVRHVNRELQQDHLGPGVYAPIDESELRGVAWSRRYAERAGPVPDARLNEPNLGPGYHLSHNHGDDDAEMHKGTRFSASTSAREVLRPVAIGSDTRDYYTEQEPSQHSQGGTFARAAHDPLRDIFRQAGVYNDTPGPGSYHQDADGSDSARKGPSFGVGARECRQELRLSDGPAPGQYSTDQPTTQGRSFARAERRTLRHHDVDEEARQRGPGDISVQVDRHGRSLNRF
ncbi:MAG: hypothetical protein MHM6MM_001944 [Cercozoa sp. M6MM]